MKLFLSLCVAAAGFVGFSSTEASAAETTTVQTLPSVVHMAPTVVVETHRCHYRRYHHRRYYYRHHRRYYY